MEFGFHLHCLVCTHVMDHIYTQFRLVQKFDYRQIIRNVTAAYVVECLLVNMIMFNPYPTAFPNGNGMVLHFYQQQESSTTKTVHKVINKGLKTYV